MITQERLKELFDYDHKSGIFRHRAHRFKKLVGAKAGHLNAAGYWSLVCDKEPISAHVLAWIYVYGEPPENFLDHIDLNPLNNSIENLREATASQNAMNTVLKCTNKSGVKGVHWRKGRNCWEATIKSSGKRVFRKAFKTLEQAELAVRQARTRIHGEFANHG